jgi:3-dehydroquinate synthase
MKTTVRHSRGEYVVETTTLAGVLAALGAEDFVVTDTNVQGALGLGPECFAVEPGERSKCLATYGSVMEWLADRATRGSRVVAFGGGVVGDLAGFAAATYMRGVACLQVPTSLLAMVDSSVGGKVAVDLAAGKNLAGAFWPPERVLVPMDALATLPDREFANGAAEVWKSGAILDRGLLERLEARPISKQDEGLEWVISRCIELKAAVVEEDEFETTGRRAVLNFGHTVGHAIEQAQGYCGLLHGEAVAVGMVAEARLGEAIGETVAGTAERLRAGLASQGLPTALPKGLAWETLVGAMRRDKKAARNGLAFSLVSEIGTCRLVTGVEESDVRRVLEAM